LKSNASGVKLLQLSKLNLDFDLETCFYMIMSQLVRTLSDQKSTSLVSILLNIIFYFNQLILCVIYGMNVV